MSCMSITKTIKDAIPVGELKGFLGEKHSKTVLVLNFGWSSSYFQQNNLLSCGEGLTFPKLNVVLTF